MRLWLIVQALWLGSAIAGPVSTAGSECRVVDRELSAGYRGECGECVGGLAHGAGSAWGSARYAGAFRAGLKHGRGVKTWANGDRYEGEFEDDRRHGHGRYTWGSGSEWAGASYSGRFVRDLRHGPGVFEWPSGDRYEGPWHEDRRMGPTVFELRREAVQRAAQEALSEPGIAVCRDWPLGSAGSVRVTASTQARIAGQAQLIVQAVAPGAVWHEGAALAAGRRITGDARDWRPCPAQSGGPP